MSAGDLALLLAATLCALGFTALVVVLAASLAGVLAGVVLVVYGIAHQLGGATGVAARQHGVLVSVSFVVGAAVTLAVGSFGS